MYKHPFGTNVDAIGFTRANTDGTKEVVLTYDLADLPFKIRSVQGGNEIESRREVAVYGDIPELLHFLDKTRSSITQGASKKTITHLFNGSDFAKLLGAKAIEVEGKLVQVVYDSNDWDRT